MPTVFTPIALSYFYCWGALLLNKSVLLNWNTVLKCLKCFFFSGLIYSSTWFSACAVAPAFFSKLGRCWQLFCRELLIYPKESNKTTQKLNYIFECPRFKDWKNAHSNTVWLCSSLDTQGSVTNEPLWETFTLTFTHYWRILWHSISWFPVMMTFTAVISLSPLSHHHLSGLSSIIRINHLHTSTLISNSSPPSFAPPPPPHPPLPPTSHLLPSPCCQSPAISSKEYTSYCDDPVCLSPGKTKLLTVWEHGMLCLHYRFIFYFFYQWQNCRKFCLSLLVEPHWITWNEKTTGLDNLISMNLSGSCCSCQQTYTFPSPDMGNNCAWAFRNTNNACFLL